MNGTGSRKKWGAAIGQASGAALALALALTFVPGAPAQAPSSPSAGKISRMLPVGSVLRDSAPKKLKVK